jgi:hypothetical protein
VGGGWGGKEAEEEECSIVRRRWGWVVGLKAVEEVYARDMVKVCACVCVRVCVCVCVCLYIHTHTHIQIRIYMY